jgi:hypothetical protein
MFVAGALPALVLVPLIIRYLSGPDAQGATAMPVTRSGRASRETISGLFRGRSAGATVAFWVATFMGLLPIYGLNTSLPEIMHAAGYSVGKIFEAALYPTSSADGARTAICSIYLSPGLSALRLRELFHHYEVMPYTVDKQIYELYSWRNQWLMVQPESR